MIKKILFASLLLILFSVFSTGYTTVNADFDHDFVYGTNHFDGNLISSSFIPPSINNIYLIADHVNVISARFTDVYYWPITNEYRADWNALNLIIEGQIEIIKDGTIYQVVDLDYYVRQFDALDQQNTTRFYFGDDAIQAREDFEQKQQQYRQDLFDYHQLLNEFRQEFQQALSDLQDGLITEEQLPERPEAFDDFTLFSTDLLKGFKILLPEGRYTIQFRTREGDIIPDSQKNLTVFSHIREGIGYKIIPEERWTAPEYTQDYTEIVYTLRNKTFYLEPFYQKQYNQLHYIRMNNPQDTQARTDHSIWVPHRSAENVLLRLVSDTGIVEKEIHQFNVQQLPGARLGYEIVEFDPTVMNQPTFSGFKISADDITTNLRFELSDQNDNQVIEGGNRVIHVLLIERRNALYLFPVLPMLLGITALIMRKKDVKNVKVVGGG